MRLIIILMFCLILSNASYADQMPAYVVKVISTDTIILDNGSRIKLIGIESFGTPRKIYPKYDKSGRMVEEPVDPAISMEDQALNYAVDLMENKKITLEYDVDNLDDRHQKLAYVRLPDGQLANIELLRQGFVRLKIKPPNMKHAEELRAAYQEARLQQRGFLSQ